MDILQDERKSGFASIVATREFATIEAKPLLVATREFADCAGGGIEKESAVIGFAVVVARGAKPQRASKNQESRWEWPPMMLRVNERRIERREIRSPRIVGILEGTKRRVDAETAEDNDDGEDLSPPGVAAESAAEPGFRQECGSTSHPIASSVAVA